MSIGIKETVIQFGEGGLLRGLVDYFSHKLQEEGLYDDKIVVAQPIEKGMCQTLSNQNCEYNLFLRGVDNRQVINERTHVTSIPRALNSYARYEEYIVLTEDPDLRILVSDITEVGVEYLGTENLTDMPPKSYPTKLTRLSYKRYKVGLRGLILLPCKLTDDNGDNLKKRVLQYARLWELEDGFTAWLGGENDFCSTLVDRTVTGYPRGGVEELTEQIGYEDKLIDTAEIFRLWVIGGHHKDELSPQKASYSIVWTDDIHPYERKRVRVLNGRHTPMVLGTYLYGLETAGECMKDKKVSAFLRKCIFEEIIPIIGDTEDNRKFGTTALERLFNPLIKHQLLSITLNSVSKFQVRVLPTILEYREKFGNYPKTPTFSMAAPISFYRTDKADDGDEIMQFMKTASVEEVMKKEDYWYTDPREIIPMVGEYYGLTQSEGMAKAYGVILGI